MIQIILCDDNAEFLHKFEAEVKRIVALKNVAAKIVSFSRGEDISDDTLMSCDVAFLDIDLACGNCSGMDIARKLRTFRKDSVIVFVTNFIEYAPEGYEVQAFRYALKRDILSGECKYIADALEQVEIRRETFKIQIDGEVIDLPLDEILYFSVLQHNVDVVMKKTSPNKPNKTYTFHESLSNLEQQLSSQGFLRIHKSYLVNMRYLKKLQCREALLETSDTLPVSEKNYSSLKKQYLLWRGWQ